MTFHGKNIYHLHLEWVNAIELHGCKLIGPVSESKILAQPKFARSALTTPCFPLRIEALFFTKQMFLRNEAARWT
jgi:hypothetical protein